MHTALFEYMHKNAHICHGKLSSHKHAPTCLPTERPPNHMVYRTFRADILAYMYSSQHPMKLTEHKTWINAAISASHAYCKRCLGAERDMAGDNGRHMYRKTDMIFKKVSRDSQFWFLAGIC